MSITTFYKAGNLKELEQKATVGTMKVEAHYDAKKNVTRVERKIKDEKNDKNGEKKEILPGMVIIGVKTEKGIITINY